MFVLSFVPDAWLEMVVNTVLVVGAVMTFLSFFVINRILRLWPGLSAYYFPVQLISAALLIAGVYFKGSYQTEAHWRAKVAEAEEKVRIAEQKAADATAQVETKVITKTKVVQGRTQTIEKEIVKEIVKYDTRFIPGGECEIPREFITLHNRSAESPFAKDKK